MALELKKPSQLPAAPSVTNSAVIPVDNGVAVQKATPKQIVDAGRPVASEAQAIAGTDNETAMTPLTTKQALDAGGAGAIALSQAWAESPTSPDGAPGTKSAKTWAGEAADSAGAAETAAAQLPKSAFDATRAPLPSDDVSQGYALGSRWLWQGQEWTLTDPANGAAKWVPAKLAPEVVQFGDVSAAFSAAGSRAVDFGNEDWSAGDGPSGYFNLYGASKYHVPLWRRVQAGQSAASPTTDPNPLLVVHKTSSADRATDPSAWDQVGYFSLRKVGGDAFGAALTGYALYQGGSGDAIGIHGRVKTQTTGSRSYAGWFYCDVDTTTPNAAHAVEMNGKSIADPGYGGLSQLLRLCMADSSATENRFSTAITIGNSTHGGDNGFWTGINIEAGALIATPLAADNGEAINIEGAATGTVGGIRLRSGAFKFGIRMDGAAFSGSNAIHLGTGQMLRWGDAETGVAMTGGSNNVLIRHGFLHIVNPVSGTAIQVDGTKVLGPRGAAIANAASGTEVATINSILSALRTHGLIA